MIIELIRLVLPALLLISLLFPLFSKAQDGVEWKKVKDNDGIQSFVMKLPEVAVNKVKVETIVKSSLSSLVALMIDTPKNPEWVFLNIHASIRHQDDVYNWVYYGQNNAPWPVCDRDVVTRVHLFQNAVTKEVVCESVAIPDYEPVHEDFTRIPMLHAIWRFTPLGEGKIKVAFELLIDLGGNMPAWLTNLAVTKGPSSSMKNFIELSKKEPYLSAKIDYIKEPQW